MWLVQTTTLVARPNGASTRGRRPDLTQRARRCNTCAPPLGAAVHGFKICSRRAKFSDSPLSALPSHARSNRAAASPAAGPSSLVGEFAIAHIVSTAIGGCTLRRFITAVNR